LQFQDIYVLKEPFLRVSSKMGQLNEEMRSRKRKVMDSKDREKRERSTRGAHHFHHFIVGGDKLIGQVITEDFMAGT